MGNVQGMLRAARKLLGTRENPPGSNRNHITRWYGFTGPWCDMAVSYAAAHSDNLPAVMGKFALTTAHARAFQKKGRFHYGIGGIRPGDIVFFDWSGSRSIGRIDHVGIVEAVHKNRTIITLEGNTSNAFLRRRRNSACIVGYGRPAYKGGSAPMPGNDGILRRGSKGQAVKTLQKNLNTVQKAKLAVDGDFGPATERALKAFQARHKLPVDGAYGPSTAAMMKAVLAGRNKPIRPMAVVAKASGALEVDGQFGPATCAALQRALNDKAKAGLDVDGAFGPLTITALQRYVEAKADGIVGPETVTALQRHLGSALSGTWDADTTRLLQKALNAGSF
ncbi:CHAP domain-containing protein [Streptomyces sp. WAC05374]|uniref:peptidoglycan-binding protein n=1 Tax=Streptomyces sp. WAC05374 TaxID=2487420 RepID=UPI000F89549D|nr:peptidoglycan-binding protein [Streptomyces sp. WAC05374]RST15063.1 CHAP domain-containing protein [Streptomyces sp. WAC05374]TDF50410.1 CHAP domain-containing protein [Streptomyces sp. WAC05374]TDF51776.1 CHAP domain-containing protein [Streptomyces sp. WAC05374]TDF60664.1 CHAP domain-containing protein [Streptomyces sp. WAC05374]